ncbi:MAG TPA: T9SS type A sorting domain-containing protein, partial [Flavisolibacter sp.]|nr:T9SS type A sorting domain-containing protein [Flavisolibacter sp.]
NPAPLSQNLLLFLSFKNVIMFRLAVTICISILVTNTLIAQDWKLTPKYISTNPNSNGFYEYLPQGYSTTAQPYALMIFIQGLGELGDGSPSQLPRLLTNGPLYYINANQFPTSFTVGGKTFKYVIISPQFIVTPSSRQIDSVITYSLLHYNVDINRVYLTGLSIGGGVSFEYAGNSPAYAKRLAALIPFASATEPDLSVVKPRAKTIADAGLHVWAFHNLNDDVSDTITTNYVKYINQYAAPAVLAKQTIFNAAGHDSWSPAYYGSYNEAGLNIYQWMLQFQGTNVVIPLPVKFSSFTATCSGEAVNLAWSTAQESNSKNFAVEKSVDGIKWNNIGTVGAAGNSSTGKNYSFKDVNNISVQSIYRIVENDIDGKLNISPAIKTSCSINEVFNIYPNPVLNKIIIRLNAEQAGKLNIKVYDSKGVLVIRKESTIPAGNSQIPCDMTKLSKGSYTINAAWDNNRRSVQVVKE